MKQSRTFLAISVLTLSLLYSGVSAAATVKGSDLRCEYLENPLGMDVAQPRLSWICDSNKRGQKQTSGDPYLTFAKQAGAVPDNATKQSHPTEREQFKVCSLAVQYGMGKHSLAIKLGKSPIHGKELLQAHKATYPAFWRWSDAAVDQAMLHGHLWTVFGWPIHVGSDPNPRSLANFPVQANGAEMLRLACCLATKRGISVCAPIHDALLVEGSVARIGDVVAETQEAMAEAGRVVLDGFELRTDAEIIAWPDRYMDKRGVVLWDEVLGAAEADPGKLAQESARVPWQEVPPRPVLL